MIESKKFNKQFNLNSILKKNNIKYKILILIKINKIIK